MTFRRARSWRLYCYSALAVVIVLGLGGSARPQDWPQWRGPLGQGITSAKNLPPSAGSTSLKVLWKTPIPGEGCSSPVVSDGRVYLTTAYEGTQYHPWDRPAFWATVILAGVVIGLALMRALRTPRVRSISRWGLALGVWTLAIVALTAIVLAKPMWFWQFADPWSGTTVAAAELPWVESLHLRPAIVLVCGSVVLIFTWLRGSGRVEGDDPPLLTRWLSFMTLAVTVVSSALLGLIGWRPDAFFQASQPWLAWLVTGGLGLFAFAGSIGWTETRRQGDRETGSKFAAACRLLVSWSPCLLVLSAAGWLFHNAPGDEFFNPLSLQNRLVFLLPGVVLLVFHASAIILARAGSPPLPVSLSPLLPVSLSPFLLVLLLAVVVFIRANYLQPQSGVVRAVVCLEAESGAVLWDTPVFVAAPEKRHSLNSLATPTPACDGERIYAYFGSGLAALDKNGRLLWLKRDADFAGFIRYGAGSSVVLAGDKIIIYRDSEFMGHGDHLDDDIQTQSNRRPTALAAYDKKTGAQVWSIAPPFSHDSYMTPLVWTRDDRLEVVVATWKTLAGFDAGDGALRWSHSYPMQQIVPSPAVNGDCLFVTGGNALPCPMMAVRAPPSKGTEGARTIWFAGKTGSNIVSPVCWDGLLFSVSHLGVLSCRDAESGQIHWTKRLDSRCLASLVAGDGKLYALDKEGTLHVFAADTTGSVLATHALGENCSATPALAAGALIVRTSNHLFCIGSGD